MSSCLVLRPHKGCRDHAFSSRVCYEERRCQRLIMLHSLRVLLYSLEVAEPIVALLTVWADDNHVVCGTRFVPFSVTASGPAGRFPLVPHC